MIFVEKLLICVICYCLFVIIMGRVVLLSFYECGIVRMYYVNDLRYLFFNFFIYG